MKVSKLFAVTLSGLMLTSTTVFAELKIVGEGKDQTLAPGQFSGAQAEQFALFKTRCTKCHAMSRPITALTTGRTPISRGSFEAEGIKEYVVKMMRKPNSGVTREDAKEIIQFLTVARELAKSN